MINTEFELMEYPKGMTSRAGVLDIGLKCPHSCEFCYYSFLDGSGDQFLGMRKAPFKTYEECKEIIDFLAANGIERIDITGGEPCYHPRIIDIVEYAEKVANIRVRIITLGQLLQREVKERGKSLLCALVEDAELTDFLFSVHSVDEELFKQITKGSFKRLDQAMAQLDALGFSYCINTMVYVRNANEPERIAKYIIDKKRNVRIVNFINMNLYYAWRGSELGQMVDYSITSPGIIKAVKMLEEKNIGVNVRFGPMCQFKGIEKNYVGITSIGFDPYEWMNGTDAQFELEPFDRELVYKRARQKLTLNNKMFTGKCKECTANTICDGVDQTYLKHKGDIELKPYTQLEFNYRFPWDIRPQNILANLVKIKRTKGVTTATVPLYDTKVVGLWQFLTMISKGIRKIIYYKMNDHIYLLEHISTRNLKKCEVSSNEVGAIGVPVLLLGPGDFIELEMPYTIVGVLHVYIHTIVDGAICISIGKSVKRVLLKVGQNRVRVKVDVSLNQRFSLSNEGKGTIRMLDPVILVPKRFAQITREAWIYLQAYGLRRTLEKISAFSKRSGRGSRPSR